MSFENMSLVVTWYSIFWMDYSLFLQFPVSLLFYIVALLKKTYVCEIVFSK